MSSYRDWESRLAPPWLRGPNGKKFLEETGGEKDVQVDRARQAVLANFPDQGPADAVPLVGADRQLLQGSGETLVNYRERLRTAWDSVEGWLYAGSHGGLLRALARGGFPTGLASGAIIIQLTKRYSYLVGNSATGVVTFATHPGWTFASTPPPNWNQFGILFGADVAGLTDGTVLAQQFNTIVRTWKPAKARYMGARIFLAGPWWDFPFGVAWNDVARNWGDGVSTGTTRFVQP